MGELQLVRSVDDRRRFELAGVGWVRSTGWLTQRADAGRVVGASEWHFEPRGWTGGRAEALATGTGEVVGTYRRTSRWNHDGEVTWGRTTLRVGRAGFWRSRYVWSVGDQPVLELGVHPLSRRRVTLTLESAWQRDPGLVLFACWLGQLFVSQDSAGAA